MRDKFQTVLTVSTPNFTHYNFVSTVFDKMLSAADLSLYYPSTDFGKVIQHWAEQRDMGYTPIPEINRELRTIDLTLSRKLLDRADPDVVVIFQQHLSNPQGTLYLKTFVAQTRKRSIPTLRAVPDRRDGSLRLDFIDRA